MRAECARHPRDDNLPAVRGGVTAQRATAHFFLQLSHTRANFARLMPGSLSASDGRVSCGVVGIKRVGSNPAFTEGSRSHVTQACMDRGDRFVGKIGQPVSIQLAITSGGHFTVLKLSTRNSPGRVAEIVMPWTESSGLDDRQLRPAEPSRSPHARKMPGTPGPGRRVRWSCPSRPHDRRTANGAGFHSEEHRSL